MHVMRGLCTQNYAMHAQHDSPLPKRGSNGSAKIRGWHDWHGFRGWHDLSDCCVPMNEN
jgi:hypothetical protein